MDSIAADAMDAAKLDYLLLSEHNNTPDKALTAAHKALEWLGVDSVSVQAAPPNGPAKPVSLVAHHW